MQSEKQIGGITMMMKSKDAKNCRLKDKQNFWRIQCIRPSMWSRWGADNGKRGGVQSELWMSAGTWLTVVDDELNSNIKRRLKTELKPNKRLFLPNEGPILQRLPATWVHGFSS